MKHKYNIVSVLFLKFNCKKWDLKMWFSEKICTCIIDTFALLLFISQFILINNLTCTLFNRVWCRHSVYMCVKWKLNDSKATNRMHNLFLGTRWVLPAWHAFMSVTARKIYFQLSVQSCFANFTEEWLPFFEYFVLFWNACAHGIIHHYNSIVCFYRSLFINITY